MAWRDPTPFEASLLEDVRARSADILPLARHLMLAPRVEPLLLRNVRLEFTPEAATETESLLWFSPLVAARSAREIVFHLGVAKLLAEEFMQAPDAEDRLDTLWRFTCRHTRHWSAEERLERDLRYHALRGDRDELGDRLRTLLRGIRAETDAKRRLTLSRVAKRSLPVIGREGGSLREARWLTQFAAQALGDAGSWVDPGDPQAPPPWLADKLPTSLEPSQLAVEVRHDDRQGQVLHFLAPRSGEQALHFSHPLPARLHIAPEGGRGAGTALRRARSSPSSPRARA